MKNKIIIIITLITLVLFPTSANAETLAQTRAKLNSLRQQYNENQRKKKEAQNNIASNKNSISNKQNEIQTNQQKVVDATNESAKLTKEIDDGKSELENLMNTYQVASGDNVYLEYIFEATSYEDLVYRYAVIEEVMDYINKKIDGYNDKIQKNNELKSYLAEREVTLNNDINNLSQQIETLNENIASFDEHAVSIDKDIDDAQNMIDYLSGLGCKENEEKDACIARTGSLTNYGWVRPLKKGVVTSYFGYRVHPVTGQKSSFHNGTDIGGNPEGTNVYAVANGVVGKIINRASCGGNQVFVWSYVNGKKYTTNYMHLLTINVSKGSHVSTNTVVGTVGGGKGTLSYERCSTGAHLHISIGTGWYGSDYFTYSSWVSHLLDSRTVIGIPAMGVWFYSRT